jgi:hypothetical protein
VSDAREEESQLMSFCWCKNNVSQSRMNTVVIS